MAEDDVRQVMIFGRLIGIVGLDDVIMKTVQTIQGSTNEEIQNSLLTAVSINNYIPAAAREDHGRAEIACFGVMGAPALVVNNKVVSVGEVPPKSKIRQWIIDACHQSIEANK